MIRSDASRVNFGISMGGKWLNCIIVVLGCCWQAPPVAAQSPAQPGQPAQPPATSASSVSETVGGGEHAAVELAVERGVAYLLSQQQASGGIHDRDYETTMTSLALMSMAAVGHQPGESTPAGTAMVRGLDFVLSEGRQDPQGYFGRKDRSRMYGHGITSLMLTELLGMGVDASQDQRIYQALDRALQLTLAAQAVPKPRQFQGGWRYEPDSRDADLSVSVWQLMAMRSAKNDGLKVPAEAIELAVEYLQGSYTGRPVTGRPVTGRPAGGQLAAEQNGGFSYMPRQNSPSFTMSAAGLLALQVCGRYEAPEVLGAANWLQERQLNWQDRFFFYGCYYYAQGMHQRGGALASTSQQNVEKMLLAHQAEDGSWQSSDNQERNAGRVYATSLALLSLSVRYHYLPIYQR